MKLRIQENLLRLRLTQTEVASLHDQNHVECATRFPSGRTLGYLLISSPHASQVSAEFDGDCIRVVVPRKVAIAWAESSEVAIKGPRDSVMQVLIEKDFQCLHKPVQQDPDAYPNPLGMVPRRSAA